MISNLQDYAPQFNLASGVLILDISKWQNTVVQFVTPSGAIAFTATNDGLGANGESPANTANFLTVLGTNLTTGATASTTSTGSIFSFGIIGKYLKLAGSAVTCAKLLVYQTKPY